MFDPYTAGPGDWEKQDKSIKVINASLALCEEPSTVTVLS